MSKKESCVNSLVVSLKILEIPEEDVSEEKLMSCSVVIPQQQNLNFFSMFTKSPQEESILQEKDPLLLV